MSEKGNGVSGRITFGDFIRRRVMAIGGYLRRLFSERQ